MTTPVQGEEIVRLLARIANSLESITQVVRASLDSEYPPRIEIKERP